MVSVLDLDIALGMETEQGAEQDLDIAKLQKNSYIKQIAFLCCLFLLLPEMMLLLLLTASLMIIIFSIELDTASERL